MPTRQQTDEPERDVKLLVVGIAPPFKKDMVEKTIAKSATNNSDDRLRKFILESLNFSWEELIKRGMFFVQSVKGGIVPTQMADMTDRRGGSVFLFEGKGAGK